MLLVDSDPKAADATFLSIALAPGGSVPPGVRPQIELPRYLGIKPLADFQAINLANVHRLDASAVAALEKYVAAGGGVAFFLGPRSDVKFYNDALYRGGKGLFPAPLGREAELLIDRLETAPDVEVEPHFIFRVLSGKQNSLLQIVAVQRYFAVPEGWRPPPDSTVRVIARLRNGAPLAVERRFGKGRVVALLTTAGPAWNNWARNPSFVVVALNLEAYLSQGLAEGRSLVVGAPLELHLDPAAYQPQVRFTPPEQSGTAGTTVGAVRASDGTLVASLADTPWSGFYEAQLIRSNSVPETRRYAVNVDPAEGDLAALGAEQLASRLQGVKYRYQQAAAFQAASAELAGSNLAEAILLGLVLLLIGEQVLAWSASYHPARRHPLGQGAAA